MKPYKHQQKVIDDNPQKSVVCFGAGTGKTLTAIRWLQDAKKKDLKKLVICPKSIRHKWLEDVKGLDVEVMTKEEFKKYQPNPDVVVVDEAHWFTSNIRNPKVTSQLTKALHKWNKPNKFLMLMTATPISSTPDNVYTLLVLSGKVENNKINRDKFLNHYMQFKTKPFLKGRFSWFPKKNWRELSLSTVMKNFYTAKMSDVVDEIPKQHKEVIDIPLTKAQKEEWKKIEEDPDLEHDISVWFARHKYEQKFKVNKIKEIAGQFSQVVVFAKYKDQIVELKKELSKQRKTFVVTGDVKDYGKIFEEAKNDNGEHYIIIQADISEGYELPNHQCVIYASQSYKKISDIQSQARVQRINNLKSNWYYWLIAGKNDNMVYGTIKKGDDFII